MKTEYYRNRKRVSRNAYYGKKKRNKKNILTASSVGVQHRKQWL